MKINQQEVPAEFKYCTKAQKVVNLFSRIEDYGWTALAEVEETVEKFLDEYLDENSEKGLVKFIQILWNEKEKELNYTIELLKIDEVKNYESFIWIVENKKHKKQIEWLSDILERIVITNKEHTDEHVNKFYIPASTLNQELQKAKNFIIDNLDLYTY